MRLRREEMPEVTATDAKNSFGTILDRAVRLGGVAILRHQRPAAVLLSIDEYERLLSKQDDPLKSLRGEFDALVARMQTPRAKAAGRALFDASPATLGRKAARARRKG